MDNCIHLPFLHSIPLILLLQGAMNFSSLFRESFELTALQFFAAWIPLRIIPHTCRGFVHPQLFMCFIKFFEILFDLTKILNMLLLLKFLLACIMVNPISLVILLAPFVTIILSTLIRYVCECSQSSNRILPFSSDVTPDMSWFLANQFVVDCMPLCLLDYPSLIRASASDPSFWKS